MNKSIALIFAASTLFLAGCFTTPHTANLEYNAFPAAKGYSVLAGGQEFWAKSVRLHGSWAELETDTGPVWVSGAVIRPKNLTR